MKTMKKWLAMLAVIVLAVFAALAVGCKKDEAKAEEFKYSKIEVTSSDPTMEQTMESSMGQLYTDYTLEVSDSAFTLKNSSSVAKMTYEKDGEKYLLRGADADKMKESMSQMMGTMGTVDSIEYYAEKTEDGWAIVTKEKFTLTIPGLPAETTDVETRIIFVKA